MLCKTRIAIAVAAACLVSPPVLADPDKDERGDGKRHEQKYSHDKKDQARHGDRRGRSDYDKDRQHGGHAQVNVPPGHLPPPGECRIWFPDRPPGHQPPPGDCRELSRHVPRGAVLVEGG